MQEYRPTQTLDKVQNAAIASALAAILLWALEQYAGVVMPPLVQGAIVTLLTFAAGYMTSLKAHEIEPITTSENDRRADPII